MTEWTETFGRMAVLAQSSGGGKSLLEHINSGGPIGYAIIVLSLIALAMVLTHVIRIRPLRFAPEPLVHGLEAALGKNDLNAALELCARPDNDSFLARSFGAALARCRRSPFGLLELRAALEESGQAQVARLYRSIDGVGLIASIAPMLGLLGTVVGMVGAFETLETTEGFARPDQLAGNISVALITTVLGLIVAIPCTAAFTYLRNRIDTCVTEASGTMEGLIGVIEGGGQVGAPTQSVPAPAPKRPGTPPPPPTRPATPPGTSGS